MAATSFHTIGGATQLVNDARDSCEINPDSDGLISWAEVEDSMINTARPKAITAVPKSATRERSALYVPD